MRRPRPLVNLFAAMMFAAACGDPQRGPPPAGDAGGAFRLFDSAAAGARAANDSAGTADSIPVSGRGRESAAQGRPWSGAFRRGSGILQFRLCRSDEILVVTGSGEQLRVLQERFRWTAIRPELPVYAVLRGRIARDSAPTTATAADPRITSAFVLTAVDSLRSWIIGDCGSTTHPRW